MTTGTSPPYRHNARRVIYIASGTLLYTHAERCNRMRQPDASLAELQRQRLLRPEINRQTKALRDFAQRQVGLPLYLILIVIFASSIVIGRVMPFVPSHLPLPVWLAAISPMCIAGGVAVWLAMRQQRYIMDVSQYIDKQQREEEVRQQEYVMQLDELAAREA